MRTQISGLCAWKCSNLFFLSFLGWYIYGHLVSFEFLFPRSRPQHTKVDSGYDPYFFFLDKKWEKRTINCELFSFLFDKIYENSTKLYENFTNIHEKVTNIHEKLTKINFSWVFSPLLIKEEEIWVISRIQFRVLWMWLRVQKFKSDKVAINFPSLGSQRKRIYSFWLMELRAVQLSKKPLDI